MYVDSTSTEEPYGMQPIAKLLRDNLEDLLIVSNFIILSFKATFNILQILELSVCQIEDYT